MCPYYRRKQQGVNYCWTKQQEGAETTGNENALHENENGKENKNREGLKPTKFQIDKLPVQK